MAGGALPREVVGRFFATVTIFAVCGTSNAVVELRSRPCGGAVAGRTLSCEMVGWLLTAVASFAIRRPNRLVIEVGLSPVCSIVTG